MLLGELTETNPCSPSASTNLLRSNSGLPGELSSGYPGSAEPQAPPPSPAPSQEETQLTAIQAFLQDSVHQLRSMPMETINEDYLRCIQTHLQDNMQLIRTMPPQIVHVLLGTCQQLHQLIDHLRHLVQLTQRTHPCHFDFSGSIPAGSSPSFTTGIAVHPNDSLAEQGHQYLVVRAILGHLIDALQNVQTETTEPIRALLTQAYDSFHFNYNAPEAIFPSDRRGMRSPMAV